MAIEDRLLSYNDRQPDHVLWRLNILADVIEAAAEITSLRAQLDEARRKAISECIEIAEAELADPKSSGRSIAKRLRDLLGG